MLKFNVNKQNFGEVSTVNKNNSHFRDKLALLSKGLMLPVAVLPIAGMLLGFGAIFPSIFGENNEMAAAFGNVISLPGTIIFRCLPILFAIAIAISFTKDAGMAGLSALISWIVFCVIQSAFLVHKGNDYYFM
jgi:PTS system glucose-specific IIC component